MLKYPIDENLRKTGECIKAEFAQWAPDHYRTRKPTKKELAENHDVGDMQPYYDSAPLLKDADPKLLKKIVSHFDHLVDTFVQHYSKPFVLRTLLTDSPLAQKSSTRLDGIMDDMQQHREQIMAEDNATQLELLPFDIAAGIYIEACNRFGTATEHHPLRPKNEISITQAKLVSMDKAPKAPSK